MRTIKVILVVWDKDTKEVDRVLKTYEGDGYDAHFNENSGALIITNRGNIAGIEVDGKVKDPEVKIAGIYSKGSWDRVDIDE